MKAGDLVTLSAYGDKLLALTRWSSRYRQHQNKAPLVGLVIKVSPSVWTWEGMQYEVRWMEPHGPKGRDGNYGGHTFIRKDLKFISRGKGK